MYDKYLDVNPEVARAVAALPHVMQVTLLQPV